MFYSEDCGIFIPKVVDVHNGRVAGYVVVNSVRQRTLAVCVRLVCFLPGVPQRNVAATGLHWVTRTAYKKKTSASKMYLLFAQPCAQRLRK